MAQQLRAIRTRGAILNAAAEVFAQHGYHGASIAQILDKAQVTRGALYFHFASKEQLVQGIFAEQVTEQGYPPRTYKLQELVDEAMALACRLPQEIMLRAGAKLAMEPQLQELTEGGPWEAWALRFASMAFAAKEHGEVYPHVVPEELGRFLVSSWVGAQIVSEVTSGWQDLEERISSIFAYTLPSVAMPAIFAQLDFGPDRGTRVLAEMRAADAAALVAEPAS
ncbi:MULTISPECIES: ScbR family autoregulator-binding transcription factor [Streptomyces]|uniref:Gamma-butyrolactone-binding protein n=1 Tax=Streptomyces rubradiris TaxID=285531 RepID=A0ABQ3REX8_STRRR|nr:MULTISPECIES: ScbR family autoregulator-binding transcription factor [Streptomyces]MDN3264577.1 ScbR family autoregulator-binding transcription factor [Streptomyces sp. CSDS2]GHG97763.1 gamma-butyrolactone-binding protein [Streptomyces rubradiris]GHI54395.1 gamma-butyrolactone-binding protein [Streptomyces rubradiris]